MRFTILTITLLLLLPTMQARAADPTEVAIDAELQSAIRFHEGMLESIKNTNAVSSLALISHHKSQLKNTQAVLKDGHVMQKLTIVIPELERKINLAKSLIANAAKLDPKYTVDKDVLRGEIKTLSKTLKFLELHLSTIKAK